jgi:hypothetical protein
LCHIVAVNELPTGAMPCLGHNREVADPEADTGIVLKRLVIETKGGPDRQCVEPFAARVGGQAVEESVVGFPRLELEQPLRVWAMKATSYRTTFVTVDQEICITSMEQESSINKRSSENEE